MSSKVSRHGKRELVFTQPGDAVGNLLGITRQPASTLVILNFTPKNGPVGTTVTIAGIGFSMTASQNTVTFSGTPATVSAATATQLVVTVPSGATTGPIAVTTPSGSATSSTPFTVTTGSVAAPPTVTSFTPTVGTPGTAVTVSGINFAPTSSDNRVQFNTVQALVNTATATNITTSVPSAATSGPITVVTPAGSGVSATDFFVPPAPYTAAAVAVTSRLTFGQSQTITLSTANTVALLLINATAGHRIGVHLTNVTLSASTVSITNPYGQVVASTPVTTAGAFVETSLLTLSGTYTITVIPTGTATGSMTLIGTCTSGRFFFREPDGTPWIEVGGSGGGAPVYTTIGGTPCPNTFMDAKIFQQTGTYQLVLDPIATNMGQITFTLYIFDDVTATVPFETATTATTTIPGQNAKLTFAGTTGQRVLVYINNAAVSGGFSILKPDGVSLSGSSMSTGAYLDTQVLPQTGTYTVFMNPTSITVGSATFTVYDVPADVTGPIAPETATTATILAPGQAANLTFTGTAGQRASVRINSTTISAGTVRVVKPDGTSLGSISVTSGFLDAITLPVTGTYTVVVDPSSINTGQATLTLYVFDDITGTLTINGPAVTVTTTIPGQRGLLTVAGTATQQVTIRLTGNTMGTVSIRLRKPDGTLVVTTTSSGSAFNMPQQTLPVTGTYTVEIDPNNPLPINTGSITVSVTSL